MDVLAQIKAGDEANGVILDRLISDLHEAVEAGEPFTFRLTCLSPAEWEKFYNRSE